MNIYEVLIEKSTQKELAELIKNMNAETGKYRAAFYSAKGFIDSHVSDPDITPEMCKKYDLYLRDSKGC